MRIADSSDQIAKDSATIKRWTVAVGALTFCVLVLTIVNVALVARPSGPQPAEVRVVLVTPTARPQ
jgi:hypothetical protein